MGTFAGGQGRPCRGDLGKALDLGLKGEKGERRTGEGDFELDFVEGECWERERVWRYLNIT